MAGPTRKASQSRHTFGHRPDLRRPPGSPATTAVRSLVEEGRSPALAPGRSSRWRVRVRIVMAVAARHAVLMFRRLLLHQSGKPAFRSASAYLAMSAAERHDAHKIGNVHIGIRLAQACTCTEIVDVITHALDDAIVPAVDYRLPGGLSWDELASVLAVALGQWACARAGGHVLQPGPGPRRKHCARVVAALARAFGGNE
jgi:hypothetical protein